ncbi:MAG: hypothetical protein IKZ58_00895 [Selenomonadaceae bacterium]|nr:hypothetical protein [Selenomonadaceae bacterium]
MFKKSFMAMMALFLVLFTAGCGGGKETPKAADDKPAVSADKSVLAYTEMYAKNDTSAIVASGLMTADSAKFISDLITDNIRAQFKEYPLDDANVEKITKKYFEYVNKITKISTKLKKDDPEHPVVEVTATTINGKVPAEELAKNEGMAEAMAIVQEAVAQGLNNDQMKGDKNFQDRIVVAIEKFVTTMPTIEHSMDITCKIDKGEDGKNHWVPDENDLTVLAQFAQGQ